MAGINAEHINPFLIASTKILKDMCSVDVRVGKPYVKNTSFTDDTLVIMIGITGEIRGQVLIAIANDTACNLASKMMMMPVTKLDEMSTSAVSELGNMILGNTATIFSTKGIGIDITPPTICMGDVSFSNNYTQNICVPLLYEENMKLEINVAVI
jgi:chemotaxis protein CheX